MKSPNYPVIVVHLLDHGKTACTGEDYNPVPDTDYSTVPRYFCVACARLEGWRGSQIFEQKP